MHAVRVCLYMGVLEGCERERVVTHYYAVEDIVHGGIVNGNMEINDIVMVFIIMGSFYPLA